MWPRVFVRRVATRPRYAAGSVLRADLRLPLAYAPGDPRAAILADPDWNGPEMVARHAPLLASNYFGELLYSVYCYPNSYSLFESLRQHSKLYRVYWRALLHQGR